MVSKTIFQKNIFPAFGVSCVCWFILDTAFSRFYKWKKIIFTACHWVLENDSIQPALLWLPNASPPHHSSLGKSRVHGGFAFLIGSPPWALTERK